MAKNFFISTALLIALAGCSGEQDAEPDGDIGSDPVKAGAPAQPGPPDLSDVLAFADPANCTPSESLRDISRKFVDQRGGEIVAGRLNIPGVNGDLRPDIEYYEEADDSGVSATLDLNGDWNGLELRQIVWEANREAMQHPRVAMIFATPFDDVVGRLVSLGFPVSSKAGPYDTDGYRSFSSDADGRYVESLVVDSGVDYGLAFT